MEGSTHLPDRLTAKLRARRWSTRRWLPARRNVGVIAPMAGSHWPRLMALRSFGSAGCPFLFQLSRPPLVLLRPRPAAPALHYHFGGPTVSMDLRPRFPVTLQLMADRSSVSEARTGPGTTSHELGRQLPDGSPPAMGIPAGAPPSPFKWAHPRARVLREIWRSSALHERVISLVRSKAAITGPGPQVAPASRTVLQKWSFPAARPVTRGQRTHTGRERTRWTKRAAPPFVLSSPAARLATTAFPRSTPRRWPHPMTRILRQHAASLREGMFWGTPAAPRRSSGLRPGRAPVPAVSHRSPSPMRTPFDGGQTGHQRRAFALSVPSPQAMPLVIAPRLSTPAVDTERWEREMTTKVMERVHTVVEKEVRNRMHFDSREVRRLRDQMYSELGSQLVFERERIGR